MKRNILKSACLVCVMILFSMTVLAQNPPPPPENPTGTGGNNLPVGGGAPVGSGIAILLALGAGYAASKWIGQKKECGAK
jgi:hypothetical protein